MITFRSRMFCNAPENHLETSFWLLKLSVIHPSIHPPSHPPLCLTFSCLWPQSMCGVTVLVKSTQNWLSPVLCLSLLEVLLRSKYLKWWKDRRNSRRNLWGIKVFSFSCPLFWVWQQPIHFTLEREIKNRELDTPAYLLSQACSAHSELPLSDLKYKHGHTSAIIIHQAESRKSMIYSF